MTTAHLLELKRALVREANRCGFLFHGEPWTEGEGENQRLCVKVSCTGEERNALIFCCGRDDKARPADTHVFVYARCTYGRVAVLTTRKDPLPRPYYTLRSVIDDDPTTLEQYTPKVNGQ